MGKKNSLTALLLAFAVGAYGMHYIHKKHPNAVLTIPLAYDLHARSVDPGELRLHTEEFEGRDHVGFMYNGRRFLWEDHGGVPISVPLRYQRGRVRAFEKE
ncbi:MAG: hypothetical protein QF486_00945 [Candidatus Woesearchaeota archaeon]|jgi:hypothetical protein|nr:hypothetical protein [Candidatus Woesearchaeota archaeon]MDP7181214.1 hypothetical protein [Candidatus Woesearchaeota archaeon]MDP7198166.1 hypothetical protein [Candidatus Woesearchaeota archaeon]MDP7467001.1 hypothetical protein [Candidatus Woesearchaeota archaeon]MDP7646671.1 hypothetical protein [Candidatus Woesearchaeota archaeon]